MTPFMPGLDGRSKGWLDLGNRSNLARVKHYPGYVLQVTTVDSMTTHYDDRSLPEFSEFFAQQSISEPLQNLSSQQKSRPHS
ncbi:hypothetical protein BGZ76_001920, partial [Entomortierella beljakovae]